MVYSTPPQFTRFDTNPASHTTKWTASRKGTSQSFRRTSSSPTPQTPTTHAITSRSTKYPDKYKAPIQATGTITDAATAHGRPCVNTNPKNEPGRTILTVRAQRT